MLWLRTPDKTYFKKGCMAVALEELRSVYGVKRAVIVSDPECYHKGAVIPVEKILDDLKISHTCFFALGDCGLEIVMHGAEELKRFEPDAVLAFGSRSAIGAAKLMRLVYDNPGIQPAELAGGPSDIYEGENRFSGLTKKTTLAAIPDLRSCGDEVSPYAVITDGEDQLIFADYMLMPDIAVVDGDNMLDSTADIVSDAGLKALAIAINAYDSSSAAEYTDSFALKAVEGIFRHLPEVCKGCKEHPDDVEKLGEAIAMAGIAGANTRSVITVDQTFEYLENVMLASAAESEESAARYAQLASELGMCDGENAAAVLIRAVGQLIIDCGRVNKEIDCK